MIIGQLDGNIVGTGSASVVVTAGRHTPVSLDIETSTLSDDGGAGQSDGAADMQQPADMALGVGAPRLMSPLSGTAVTNPRPVVTWELAPGTTNAELQFCANRQFTSLVGTTTVDPGGASGRSDVDLPAGVVFWRVRATTSTGPMTSAVWMLVAPKRIGASQISAAWGHVLDVNGDGFGDIAITAPAESVSGAMIGRVYVYPGGGAGITSATVPTAIDGLDGPLTLPTVVASGGDLNGDGYGELLYRGGSGHAYVFNGGPNGIANMAAPAAMLKNVEAIAGAGDIDGDGYGDVIVGNQGVVSIYYGSAAGLAASPRTTLDGTDANGGVAPSGFGGSVAAAGDVNADGFADILVGATGKSFVYLGSKTQLTPRVLAPSVGTDQTDTHAAAGIGDINADGYPDVIVSGTSTANKTNAAFVFLGGATTMTQGQVLVGPAGSGFAVSIAPIGDLNGDGHPGVVIGAPYLPATSTVPGAVYVYVSDGSMLSAEPVLNGPFDDNSNFGASVAGAGDINGDGRGDFVIGAFPNNTAWVYRGPWTGISPSTITGPAATSSFGSSVAE
jgi:hypothetical protein